MLSQNGVLAAVHTSWDQWPHNHVPSISEEPVMFLIDIECDGSHLLLLEASRLQLFNEPYRWLIIDERLEADIEELNLFPSKDTSDIVFNSTISEKNLDEDNQIPVSSIPFSEVEDIIEVFELNVNLSDYTVDQMVEKLLSTSNKNSNIKAEIPPEPCQSNYNHDQLEDIFLLDITDCENQEHVDKINNLNKSPKKLLQPEKFQKLQIADRNAHQEKSMTSELLNKQTNLQLIPEYILFNLYNATFGGLNVYVDSQVLIGRSVSKEYFELVEVHRRGPQEGLVFAVIGEWKPWHGIQWNTELVLSSRRKNLHQTTLKASMVVTNPDTLNHLDDLEDKHIDTITKVNYALLTHILEIMNASVEYRIVDSWGYATNGSWNGMVGDLQRQEAEIGATALFFTSERIPILDYIAMTTPTRAAFVFRSPPLSYVSNIFTLPFTRSVWIASSVLLFIFVALLYTTSFWEMQRKKRVPQLHPEIAQYIGVKEDVGQLQASFGDITMLTLASVCQQGSPVESRGIPGRIVSFMLFITVIFLYTSYSANIVALLQSSTTSIRTLNDLLHSRLQLGVHDIVYNRHYFKVASDPVRKAIYKKKVVPPNGPEHFMSLEDGIKRVRKGLFAFHLELSSGYQMIQKTFREDEKCGLQTITFLQVIDPYLAVRKNTPYKEIMKVGYRKIQERGLQDRTLRRLYTRRPKCVNRGSNFVSVGIIDCYPALLVLIYGVACSASIFILEMLVNKRNQMFRRTFVH